MQKYPTAFGNELERGIVNTFGKSESLNLKPKPEDARLIENTLYNCTD